MGTNHYPAAFINSIAEEGSKAEAVEWLQKTWNNFKTLQTALFVIKDLSHNDQRIQAVVKCALEQTSGEYVTWAEDPVNAGKPKVFGKAT